MQVCESIGHKYQIQPGSDLVKEIQWGNERVVDCITSSLVKSTSKTSVHDSRRYIHYGRLNFTSALKMLLH